MFSRTLAIADLELRIGLRNRWLLLATLILAAFSLVLALLGSAPAGTLGVDRMVITVASLASLSVYLVPLLALLLAFDAVAGEIDRGTALLIFSTPIARLEFLAGKSLGQFVVLLIALIIGYGLTAGVLVATGGGSAAGLPDFARLVATSALLGLAFLAIGYVASSATRAPGTAAALAIGIWLVAVVLYDLALLGALVADDGGVFSTTIFPLALLANPADAFRLFNLAALGASDLVGGMAGVTESLPYPPAAALAAIAVVTVTAFLAAAGLLRRIEP